MSSWWLREERREGIDWSVEPNESILGEVERLLEEAASTSTAGKIIDVWGHPAVQALVERLGHKDARRILENTIEERRNVAREEMEEEKQREFEEREHNRRMAAASRMRTEEERNHPLLEATDRFARTHLQAPAPDHPEKYLAEMTERYRETAYQVKHARQELRKLEEEKETVAVELREAYAAVGRHIEEVSCL